MNIDVSELIQKIIDALKGEVLDGWQSISSFAENQSKRIATQAAIIARERVSGALKDDDDLFKFFTDQLERLTENFARAVAGMTIATVEKAWNAVVNVVWGAINTAVGAAGFAALPIPKAPAP